MTDQKSARYYLSRKSKLLERFEKESERWRSILSEQYGEEFAENTLLDAKLCYVELIPTIPYIGGEENHLTGSLVGSVECLSLYQAMKARGKTAAEVGRVLYEVIVKRYGEPIPEIQPSQRMGEEELMRRRKVRAEKSKLREYDGDFVYEYVEGDSERFDYGYNFIECATQKFYLSQGAEEFLPFYCFLDFPKSRLYGLGLQRTHTIAEGYEFCDFRFKSGSLCEEEWPPAFMSSNEGD